MSLIVGCWLRPFCPEDRPLVKIETKPYQTNCCYPKKIHTTNIVAKPRAIQNEDETQTQYLLFCSHWYNRVRNNVFFSIFHKINIKLIWFEWKHFDIFQTFDIRDKLNRWFKSMRWIWKLGEFHFLIPMSFFWFYLWRGGGEM